MMSALSLHLLCVAYLLLVGAKEKDILARVLQSGGAEVDTTNKNKDAPHAISIETSSQRQKAKIVDRMRKQELVAAKGISHEVAAMNYDIRWGNEWFLMNDERRKGTNIYIFGAFWDVRARQFNLRYGYWTQNYEVYMNQTAEAKKRENANPNVITSGTTKLNLNPYNQTLMAEMQKMYFNLEGQGYSRESISNMLRGNFSAEIEKDKIQQMNRKEKSLKLQEETMKKKEKGYIEEASSSQVSRSARGSASGTIGSVSSTVILGVPTHSTSSLTTAALWDPNADKFKERGGSTLSIDEAKNQEGLSEIQLKKLFNKSAMRQRRRDALGNKDSYAENSVSNSVSSGSGSGSSGSDSVKRRLEGKAAPGGAKSRLSKLPTGIGDGLYVRVYMVAHKKLIGPGVLREGFVDYRVGACEFHYRSGKITQGKYFLQVQSRELNKPGKSLAAAYAVCHLDDFTGGEYPEGVALQPLNYRGEKQIMMIRGNRRVIQNLGTKFARPKKFLAICVRPIYRAYRDYQQLANFLLFYSHVGANHIVIYNSGVASPRLMGLLDIAKRANVSLELRNWNIQDDLAYENMQNMNIEVCLHSLMGFYKYVAVVDLDELIVPMKAMTLPDMIQYVTRDTPKMIDKPHALVFKTSFFCKTNSPRITYPGYQNNGDKLMILRDIHRTNIIHEVRYKYIVRPESLYEASVHFPLVSPKIIMRQWTKSVLYVNASDALIHHYRDIELNMNDVKENKNCSIKDATMFKYADGFKSSQIYKLLANDGYWQPAERQTKIQESTRISFDASQSGAGHIISAYDKGLYYEKIKKIKKIKQLGQLEK